MAPVRRLARAGSGGDSDPVTTNLARLITDAMQPERLSLGEIERRGGPNKAALSYLLRKWTGVRNVDSTTLDQLSHALRISRRSLGRAAAVDMGLLPQDEVLADDLALLADALRERADEQDREVVVAAARAVWRVLEDRARHDEGPDATAGEKPPLSPAQRKAADDRLRARLDVVAKKEKESAEKRRNGRTRGAE